MRNTCQLRCDFSVLLHLIGIFLDMIDEDSVESEKEIESSEESEIE